MATSITSSDNVHTISGLGSSETSDALPIQKLGGVIGAVALTSISGAGGRVDIEVSLDGTNYFTMRDLFGDTVEFVAAGYSEFSTACAFIRATADGSVTTADIVFNVRN